MCLLLALFLCSAIVERCGGPNHFSRNSRLGEFNSRLGGYEFPFRAATGIHRKGLIWHTVLAANRRLRGENRKKSRLRGKNREFSPAGGTGNDAAS